MFESLRMRVLTASSSSLPPTWPTEAGFREHVDPLHRLITVASKVPPPHRTTAST